MGFPKEKHVRIATSQTMRRRAREQWLEPMYAEQLALCWWCKSYTVMTRFIPKESIIVLNDYVTWRDGEHVFSAAVATVDHVTPLRDDGDNRRENLVMACAKCNNDRTRTKSTTPMPIRRMCPDCAGPKEERRTRCKLCFVAKTREWLVANGWKEIASQDEQTRFRDPATGVVHIMRYAVEILKSRPHSSNGSEQRDSTSPVPGSSPGADIGQMESAK